MRPAFRFLKQELLEISAVPVPAHPNALKKAMGDTRFRIVVPELPHPILRDPNTGPTMATGSNVHIYMYNPNQPIATVRLPEQAEPKEAADESLSAADIETIRTAIQVFRLPENS